ncbi:unnamed protein product, partial [Brachionus calyciflorus]
MNIQAFLELDAELSGHKAVSPNEAHAVVKNRIEDKKLNTRFKMLNMEAKLNFMNLYTIRNEAFKTARTVKLSTGYAECTRNDHMKKTVLIK